MELANELLDIILSYLDQFTKYKLYGASKIPYLSPIMVGDGTIKAREYFTGQDMSNVIIRELIINSSDAYELHQFPHGIRKVTIIGYSEQISNSLINTKTIKKLVTDFSNFVQQKILEPFEEITFRWFGPSMLKNMYLPNAKKITIGMLSDRILEGLILSSVMPNLNYIKIKDVSLNRSYLSFEGLKNVKISIPNKIDYFELTPNVISLKHDGPIIYHHPNNLIALSGIYSPSYYTKNLIKLEITLTKSKKNELDLSDHNLIYLKIPEIFYLVNGDKIFNPKLKKLHLTDVHNTIITPEIEYVTLGIATQQYYLLEGVLQMNKFHLKFHNSEMHGIIFDGRVSKITIPDTVIDFKLIGELESVNFPLGLKKLHYLAIASTFNLPEFIEILILGKFEYNFHHLPQRLKYYRGPKIGITARYCYYLE